MAEDAPFMEYADYTPAQQIEWLKEDRLQKEALHYRLTQELRRWETFDPERSTKRRPVSGAAVSQMQNLRRTSIERATAELAMSEHGLETVNAEIRMLEPLVEVGTSEGES